MYNQISKKATKSVILRWRRKKNLCLICGKDKHDDNCIENYDKVDNRETSQETDNKILDENKKKKTIIAYRKKKNLCLKCGKNEHQGACFENYEQTDNRDEKEKKLDPRTVITPKNKDITTIEFLIKNEDKIVQTLDFEIMPPAYNRNFITVDIKESIKGFRIDFTLLRYLSKKFQHDIVCVLGNLENLYPWEEVLCLRKLTNISEVHNLHERNIVNHIMYCKLFLSFPSKYTSFAKEHNRPLYIFQDGKNVLSSDVRVPKIFF